MTVQLEFTDVCLFVMCQWFWFHVYTWTTEKSHFEVKRCWNGPCLGPPAKDAQREC